MEQQPIQGGPGGPKAPQNTGPVRRADDASGRSPQAESTGESPAFHVLLERLSKSASELENQSATVDDSRHLAGAVDQARDSLNEALALGGRLLEAWRAEQQARAQDGEPTPENEA